VTVCTVVCSTHLLLWSSSSVYIRQAFNYFAFSLLIPLYLTAEFGISDFQASFAPLTSDT